MLKREDLNPKIRPLDLQKATLGTIPLLRHKVFTNGIHYLNLAFQVSGVSGEDLGYLSLLCKMLGEVSGACKVFCKVPEPCKGLQLCKVLCKLPCKVQALVQGLCCTRDCVRCQSCARCSAKR